MRAARRKKPLRRNGIRATPANKRLAARLVHKNGCLEWTGATNGNGYGIMRMGSTRDLTRRIEYVHRVAWTLERGPIPDELQICHSCDNRLCCDVAHMFLGTHIDNAADRDRKGRWRGLERLRPRVMRKK